MRRFLFWVAVFFGLFLTIYTVRILVRERDMARVNVKQFKKDFFTITSSDLFAERNIVEVFYKRYGVQLKFSFKNNFEDYLALKMDSDAVIYPSFVYENLMHSKMLKVIDVQKVPNVKSLMEDSKSEMMRKYNKSGVYAVPVAYVPYAMFFSKSQLKESTSGKEIIALTPSIALADNIGSLLMLCKIYKLPVQETSIKQLKKILKNKTVTFFNPDEPISMSKILTEAKPRLILAPSYNKNILEREFGSFEMILPSEGSYAEKYLVSLLKDDETELSHVFLNHLLEPLIHRNLAEVMGIGITNYAAMANITPVLYNGLKMNNPEYLKDMFVINSDKDYANANRVFEKFKADVKE